MALLAAMNSEEPLTNRAEPLLLAWEKRLASGEIDEAEWFRGIAAEITPAYLSSDNPRDQSGFIGDEAHWMQARGIIADAIDRAGTFLDCRLRQWISNGVRRTVERGEGLSARALRIGHFSRADCSGAPTVTPVGRPPIPRKRNGLGADDAV